MLIFIASGLVFIGALLGFYQLSLTLEQQRVTTGRRKLQELITPGSTPAAKKKEKSRSKKEKVVRNKTAEDKNLPAKGLRADLIRADLKIRPYELRLMQVGLGIGLFLFALVSGRGEIAAIILGVVGFYGPRWYVKRRKNKRKSKFERQLADSLGAMAAALKGGISLNDSFKQVATNGSPPIRDEFDRLLKEVGAGLDMNESLEGMVNRMQSEELALVVTAIKVNKEVGGKLAVILDRTAKTINDRQKLRGKINAATAQSTYTTYFMMALPILLGLAISAIAPAQMQDFVNGLCGRIAMGVVVFLETIGYFMAKKLGSVNV